jgi:PAS domain S-box-containing protein
MSTQVSDLEFRSPAIPEVQRLLAAIWESASEAIAVSDPDGRVLMANPAYYALYGRTPEEVLGQSFAVIFPPDQQEAAETAYRATFEDQAQQGSVEAAVQRADGTPLTVESHWHFISEGNRRIAMVSLVLDVTERKRLQTANEDIVEMILHDLRTPLTAIIGYAQLLQRRSDSSIAGIVDTILERSRTMHRLIADLADIARSDRHNLTLQLSDNIDLREVVEAVVDTFRLTAPERRFEIMVPPTAVRGCWDRMRIEQVIENLISNGIKYSPEDTAITVRVEDLGSEALVAVQDRGGGIPLDRLATIFDRFFRLDEHVTTVQGWGIGLFISKEFIEAHGGRIWADSPGLGLGSTISFTLPYQPVVD